MSRIIRLLAVASAASQTAFATSVAVFTSVKEGYACYLEQCNLEQSHSLQKLARQLAMITDRAQDVSGQWHNVESAAGRLLRVECHARSHHWQSCTSRRGRQGAAILPQQVAAAHALVDGRVSHRMGGVARRHHRSGDV